MNQLHESTAALGAEETERVASIFERLRDQGLTVLVIGHSLEHVFRCADCIVAMHREQVTAVLQTSEATRQDVVAQVMGSQLSS